MGHLRYCRTAQMAYIAYSFVIVLFQLKSNLPLKQEWKTAAHREMQKVLFYCLISQLGTAIKGRLLIQMVPSNSQHHHLLLIP